MEVCIVMNEYHVHRDKSSIEIVCALSISIIDGSLILYKEGIFIAYAPGEWSSSKI